MRRGGRPALAAAVALAAGSVTLASPARSGAAPAPVRGGVLRVAWIDGGSGANGQAFSATDNFDPTGEYLSEASAVLETEVETLVGYEHVAGVAGNRLVPDLAQALPTPTNGGTTYTFHLKPDIRFGPPVDREITSRDFVTALDRLANPRDGGQYAFYYTVIKGWGAYADGRARTIAGISTPNPRTIVFTLTRPTGDFLYRMSMHGTAPQPGEVVRCFAGEPGAYGYDLISTGPYMLKGIEHLNASSCATLKPDT